jgi:Spy/CpxP family protein refolding chaperone
MMGPGSILGPMMGAALDLTDAQKAEIRAIYQNARQANQSLHDQLRTIHEQELAAIKAGKSDAELQSLANSAGPLMAQLHASNLIAQAKAYKVLTPEQREKLEQLRSQTRERVQQRRRRNQ